MRKLPTLVAAGLLALSGSLAAEEPKPLAAGDPAPAFSLPGSDGKAHALADHAEKRVVVLAWFPKAFTGG
jgi:peroxiredoxin Q/BCP